MTYEFMEPESPEPWDLDQQLHGAEYDEAQAELDFLDSIHEQVMEVSTFLVASINMAQIGEVGDNTIEVVPTPEGYTEVEPSCVYVSGQSLDVLEEKRNDVGLILAQIEEREALLAPRLWQERGTRLFERWMDDDTDLAPEVALNQYFELWNSYTPNEFYEHCGVTREEVVELFRKALTAYGAKVQSVHLPENELLNHFIINVTEPAAELGLNLRDYGIIK